jgi:hypothetical protein
VAAVVVALLVIDHLVMALGLLAVPASSLFPIKHQQTEFLVSPLQVL